MALVRILVDGYSLLHNWPAVAPGRARHTAAAREELIDLLTRYQDAARTPVTIVFDGSGTARGRLKPEPSGAVEVLFSRAGRTADDLIERAVHRFQPFGEVMVVTDDHAERDTVIALGGSAVSCLNFISMYEAAVAELADEVKLHNRSEQNRFRRNQ